MPFSGPVALDRLLSPTADDPPALPLRVAIRGATALIDDARTGLTWRAEPVDIAIERGPDGVSGDFSLAMKLGDSSPNCMAPSAMPPRPRHLDLDLSFDGLLPADIPAPVFPELAPLRQIEAALSGKLQARIDLDSLHAPRPRASISRSAGTVAQRVSADGGVAIENGELRAAYDPDSRECALTRCGSISAAAASWRLPAPGRVLPPS